MNMTEDGANTIEIRTKDEESYFSVLNALNKKWAESNIIFDRIHVDYESAHIRALNSLWDRKKIYGCIFHFASAMMRHIRSELPNLSRSYNQDKTGATHRWVYSFLFFYRI